MPIHSRPHLTTHNRGEGHSAVAAAAYRLGIRLLDRRTGAWHDYTQRAAHEEVVAALTIAPDDAPEWASDPDELWNRVEESEKRKDAQIARDYVVPIPLGLTDAAAETLATLLARYICEQHHTPVTVAVHRDAETDLFGEVKPRAQQGFHAHLLFPTRRLLGVGESEATSAAGFGAKLTALSNRRTSSGLVELMNAHWAKLANELAAEAGLVADYDHRSYERLGIDRTPQPRLSRKAVALIKKGVFPPAFDALRDIAVAAKPGVPVPGDTLYAQWEQARLDVAHGRLAGAPPGSFPDEVADGAAPPAERPEQSGVAHAVSTTNVAPGQALPEDGEPWPEVLMAARIRGAAAHAALADRFVAAMPEPQSDDEGVVLLRLSGLVWTIQRVLRKLAGLAEALAEVREQIRGWDLAGWTSQRGVDEARRRKAKLEASAIEQQRAHRWSAWAYVDRKRESKVARALGKEAEREGRIGREHARALEMAQRGKAEAQARRPNWLTSGARSKHAWRRRWRPSSPWTRPPCRCSCG